MNVQRLERKLVGEDLPETVCINFYVLEHPVTKEVRYVGRTVDPSNRFRNHIWEAKKNNRNHKERWIVSLLRRNQTPVMRILWSGYLSDKDTNNIETKLIKHFAKTCRLTNSVDRAKNVSVIPTKQVFQFTMEGKFIGKFVNANQAAIATGVHDGAITSVCSYPEGRSNRSRGGFLWSYTHTPPTIPNKDYRAAISEKKTGQYTKEGELISSFKSAREASKLTGVCYKRISACLTCRQKTAGGFIWKLMKI